MDWVESKVDKLKEPMRTTARYALITRDTALFQGLARSVQYGDFVAKAVLYQDLTNRKKQSKKEALAAISESFVNYNRLAGRGRQYLESVGLLWFYNYKLRIMKEAAYMLRNYPLRSLLVTAMPALPLIGDIGTPVTDNIVSIMNDGYEPFASYDRDGKLVLFLPAEVPTLEWDLCRPQPSSSSSINKFRGAYPASLSFADHC